MISSNVEPKTMGRPPKSYVSRVGSFAIRQDIFDRLNTCKNKTEVVNEALELYFDLDGQSAQWLLQRREELKRELKSIESTLESKNQRDQETKIRLEQEKLKATNLAEIYAIAGDRTEPQLKVWSVSRLKRAGISFEEFLKYYNDRKQGDE